MTTMLTWLADACRETGYPTVELPGWQSRGHGPMTAGHGVVGHWTAGPPRSATSSNTPSLAVVRDGRPGLSGPLCNVYTAFDGTLYVVAAGKAYHAGVSSWRGESDLNGLYAGNEVESPGNFDYTAAQLDVTPRLHAALLRRMARGSEYSTAHFEVADPDGRKQDGPARNMAAFRSLVGRYLANPTTIRKPTPGGFMAALSDDDQLRMFNTIKHLDAMFSQNNTVGDVNAIASNEALQGTAIAALAKGQVAQSAQLAEILARLPAPSPGA